MRRSQDIYVLMSFHTYEQDRTVEDSNRHKCEMNFIPTNVLCDLLHISSLITLSTTRSEIQYQTTLSTFRGKQGSMTLKTRLFDCWGNEN